MISSIIVKYFEFYLDNEFVVSFVIVSLSRILVISVSGFLFPYLSKVWVTVVIFFLRTIELSY